MTNKDAFTEEEWGRLRRAPMVAGMAISLADPGGPIELTKETMASLKMASSPPSDEELLIAVSQEIMAMGHQKQNPMGDFALDKAAPAGPQILAELSSVNEILDSKASPEPNG
jgi:hypothetical protein